MREIVRIIFSEEAEKKLPHSNQISFIKGSENKQSERDKARVVFKFRASSAPKTTEIVSLPITSTTEETVSTRNKNSSIAAVSATDGITSGSVSLGIDSDLGGENKKRFIPSLNSLQSGEQEEWSRWIEESTPVLEGVAARIMRNTFNREDLIQETWIKALKSINTVQNPSFVNSWLTRILINTINSNYRRERHTIDFEEKDAFLNSIAAKGADIEERIGSQDLIERLPPEMAEQMIFIIEGGYSVQEIAEILDIPVGTVKTRRMRGLAKLRNMLEASESEDVTKTKNIQRGEKIVFVSDDSISGLTRAIDALYRKGDREGAQSLRRKRMSLAIKLLREQGKVSKSSLAREMKKRSKFISLIEAGERSFSQEELEWLIAYFDNSSDSFETVATEVNTIVAGKEPEQRIKNSGDLVGSLIKITGKTHLEVAPLIDKKRASVTNILSNATTISVKDLRVILANVEETHKKKEEAVAVLKVEAADFSMVQKTERKGMLGDAVRTLRKKYNITQEGLSRLLSASVGSSIPIDFIESGKRRLTAGELEGFIKMFKTYGTAEDDRNIQILEAFLREENNESEIPEEIRRAGTLFSRIIESGDIRVNEWTEGTEKDAVYFEQFISGAIRNPDIPFLAEVLTETLDASDPRLIELRDILYEQLEEKWMSTLVWICKNPRDIVKCLRLSTYSPTIAFAQKANISDRSIWKSESGVHNLSIANLNAAIQASTIGILGEKSIPAQFTRMKYNQKKLMERGVLECCDKKDLVAYFANLIGYSITKMDRQIREASDPASGLIEILKLSKEDEADNALIHVIRHVFNVKESQPPPAAVYEKAVSGKYVFAGHIPRIKPYQLSVEELSLKDSVQGMAIGKAMRKLRENKGLSLAPFAEKNSHNEVAVTRMELGQTIPEESTIAHLMQALGYDIYNPLTWDLLSKVRR